MNINHACLVCLGSNKDGHFHLMSAQQALLMHFNEVHMGQIVVTRAEGNIKQADYLNQAARFRTKLCVEDVERILKQIEKKNGRTFNDKMKGSVPLDIDLLVYDDILLRPNDLEKAYVKLALESLSSKNS